MRNPNYYIAVLFPGSRNEMAASLFAVPRPKHISEKNKKPAKI